MPNRPGCAEAMGLESMSWPGLTDRTKPITSQAKGPKQALVPWPIGSCATDCGTLR